MEQGPHPGLDLFRFRTDLGYILFSTLIFSYCGWLQNPNHQLIDGKHPVV